MQMKYTFLPLLIFLLLCSDLSFAQQYVNLSVDNDLYFNQDWYYSSGIFISTGKLKQEEDQETAFPKRYVHWTLGQEIYTPSRRYSRNVDLYDYPYGGWLFLERSLEKYKSLFSAWRGSILLGITGKASLAPYFQNLYHSTVLGLPDVVWLEQMPQRFHINLNGSHRKRLPLANKVSLLYEFFGNLGTQRIAAGGRLGVLVGTSQALSFLGNPLEMKTKGYGIYLGTRQEYRHHDYMLSGSLFDDKAPFVLESIPYKNSIEIGFAYYTQKWRFLTLFNSVTKDNELQMSKRHKYLNFSIGRFF